MPETKENQNAAVAMALGNFDGLHLGHMSVLQKTLDVAKEKKQKPCVLLFDEHPKKLLLGERPPMLMTDEKRNEILKGLGFEIITVSFEKFCNMSEEEFLFEIYHKYNVRSVCCGFNYRFGKGGKGDTSTLKKECERLGIEPFALEEVVVDNETVSSTSIRRAIENGEIEKANKMLSRAFSYKFEVVSGDRRGRLLGFPTINQFFPDGFVTARFGVYASKVKIDNKWYSAVTNIGIRPTVDTERFRSETCILGFSGNLYGQKIEVHLLKFLRDEKKFEDLQQLSEAIKNDAERAKEVFLKETENE